MDKKKTAYPVMRMDERIENRLKKQNRKYRVVDYRKMELFCKDCGKSLGTIDVLMYSIDFKKYCYDCIKHLIRETPYEITTKAGKVLKVISDDGFIIEVVNDYMQYTKHVYYNTKGRFINIQGERIYL